MYLFDASSIINLVKRGLAKIFRYGKTLDLAIYESMNTIWKEYKLLKNIDKETANEYISILADIFMVIDKLSITGHEKEIFKTAVSENITVYDASYLYLAIKNNLTLVTDDEKLRNKALKHIKVINSDELSKKYLENRI